MGQFDPYDYTDETLAALDTLAMLDPIMATDGYKLGHVEMYPDNLTGVLANFTARSSRIDGITAVVAFGMRAAMVKVYMDWQKFFRADIDEVSQAYSEQVRTYLNLPKDATVRVDHLRTLHYYGRLPLRVRALDEGTLVPLNVPMMTVENTQPWAAWLVNYIETALSWRMWQPITTATLAWRMRRMLDKAAADTGAALEGVPFQAHDFSARGLTGDDAVAASGAAHLLAFYGTDSLPSIGFIRRFYGGSPSEEIIAASVLASEHSVMSAGMADQPAVLGGNPDETALVQRILAKNPSGIISLVGDTFNLWHFITVVLAGHKDAIMSREGRIVVRPDSGDPELILCGDPNAPEGSPERKGVIELLWDIFGGTVNAKGFRELDVHIGAIYGDGITFERAMLILARLAENGYASTNVVLGVGSFGYQYQTRDTFGMAMKTTWVALDLHGYGVRKDPITDNGGKRSAKGRLAVLSQYNGTPYLVEEATPEQEDESLLRTFFDDGKFITRGPSFAQVRDTLKRSQAARDRAGLDTVYTVIGEEVAA